MVCDGQDISAIKLEHVAALLVHLEKTVQELQENGRELVAALLLAMACRWEVPNKSNEQHTKPKCALTTSHLEGMSEGHPLLLDEHGEALQCAIVGVQ